MSYGIYVGTAYFITLLVFIVNGIHAWLEMRKTRNNQGNS